MRRPLRGRYLLALLATMVMAIPKGGHSAEILRQDREKAAVRAIFAMLLERMHPGDGWSYDLPCVFSERWHDFILDTGREVRPRALLSPREALDPNGHHPEMFCDREARNAYAKEMAKALPGDDHARINTANMDFTYPIFNRRLNRAALQHTGGNDAWFKSGKTDFVWSWRNVHLRKMEGRWTAEFETLGIAN